jgi:photosystem II stability/assembly factor-like uncharacterized protein
MKSYTLIVSAIVFTSLLSFITNNSFSQWREKHNGTNYNSTVTGISFINPSTGFIGFTNYVGFTSDSGKSYVSRYITSANTNYNGFLVNLTFGFDVKGVLAFSADSLFAYGDYGTEPSILFSHDGGISWKLVFHRNYNMYANVFNEGITDIQFPGNGVIGFAVHNEEILKTNNRGQTWYTVQSAPNAELRKLSFPSQNVGFVSGKDKIYKTINAGTSWFSVALPDAQDGVRYDNIFFTSIVSGYVMDNNFNKIYKTSDGSASWTKMNDETLDPINGNDLYFINDSTGFAALPYYYTIEKTSDNGKTWEPCKRDNDNHNLNYGFNTLYFLNSQTGWCGGGVEYLEITTDGAKETYPKAYFKIDTTGLYATNTVNLVNYSKKTYSYKWYKNNVLISTAYNASYTHTFSQQVDTIKLIVSNGVDADTSIKYQNYKAVPSVAITQFLPTVGSAGTRIEITGSNLSTATNVYFGGTAASSFQIISDQQIDAIVSNGTSGTVTVSSAYTSSSLTGFIYNPPPVAAAPVITGFSPSSGPVGTVVTIKGNNFNTDPQKDLVLFGTAKVVVTSASTSQLVCTVPTATTYQSISVLDLNTHLSASSLKPFNIVFADSATITPSSFRHAYDITLPGFQETSLSVNACDVDGDGKTDLLSPLFYKDSIQVFRNTSDINTISFEPGKTICPSGFLSRGYVTMADLDGDGKPDFVNTTNASWVTITRNTSSPGFISVDKSFNAPVGGGSRMVAIGDLDGDGRPEIACAASDGRLSILRNTSSLGSISFAAETDFSAGSLHAVAVAIGDFDGDGKKDVITSGDSTISVFRNLSTKNNIAFAQRMDISVPNVEDLVFVVDYDGDNKLDIVQPTGTDYRVFRNISTPGNIAFAAPVICNGGGGSTCLGNLKGSGNADFVSAGAVSTNMSTPGNISSSYVIGFPIPATSEVCADINGDGKQDIIAVKNSTISVFKNYVGIDLPFTMCSMGTDLIFSDLTASVSYQWQEDTGRGFNNIYDNANFQGTNTEGLSFFDVPASWDGRRYRCIIDGYYQSSVQRLDIYKHFTPVVTITGDSVICQGGKHTHVYVPDVSQEYGNIYDFRWQVNSKPIDTTYFVVYSTNYHFKNNDTLMLLMDVGDWCDGTPEIDTSRPLIIHVLQTPEKPGPIIGPTHVISGSSNEYYIDSVNGANTYTWTSSLNALNLPQTTTEPQVNVNWNNNFQNSDYICVTAANVCGTSEASCTNLITLPLTLISFTAQRNNTANLLKWSTADEINTDHFEIQRSSNGRDFSAIGNIQSLNNGKITNNYQYTDNRPLKALNFYRLKMVDKDGKYTYSLVRSINNTSSFDVTVYPNPVKNNLVLDFVSDKNTDMQVQIVNAEGKVVYSGKMWLAAGESKQTIDATAFSAGNYFIKLISTDGETALKFVKQ